MINNLTNCFQPLKYICNVLCCGNRAAHTALQQYNGLMNKPTSHLQMIFCFNSQHYSCFYALGWLWQTWRIIVPVLREILVLHCHLQVVVGIGNFCQRQIVRCSECCCLILSGIRNHDNKPVFNSTFFFFGKCLLFNTKCYSFNNSPANFTSRVPSSSTEEHVRVDADDVSARCRKSLWVM